MISMVFLFTEHEFEIDFVLASYDLQQITEGLQKNEDILKIIGFALVTYDFHSIYVSWRIPWKSYITCANAVILRKSSFF